MFVLNKDGGLVQLQQEEFGKEEDFQVLLANYPALLAGELISPDDPRRWLLVTREIPVPGEEGGSGIWSADHLFLDQDGIPTIVEVKRQSDTRARREVVAQMLDYAANGVAYWTVEKLRAAFETTCSRKGDDPDQAVREFLGPEAEPEKFWGQVQTNLDAQKLRLLFVADVVSRELRRIVEFLNFQMNPTEVLALELKHYVGGDGLKTLSPSLFGQSERALSAKHSETVKLWDEASFFQVLAEKAPGSVETAKAILAWMRKSGLHTVFGRGRVDGSITGYGVVNGLKLYPLTLWTHGRMTFNFSDCLKPPFDSEDKRREWQSRLNAIEGISVPDDKLKKYPGVALSALKETEVLKKFLSSVDWFVAELASYRAQQQS